jgi:hypothetical protein
MSCAKCSFMVHVSVGSPVGSYNVGSRPFFRYIVRLADAGLSLHPAEQDALELLSSIPDATLDEGEFSGHGWRIIPAASVEDWPVLEATPQRLRTALQTAHRLLWENATPVGITAREIVAVEEELDKVFMVLAKAEAAGYSVNISYVS